MGPFEYKTVEGTDGMPSIEAVPVTQARFDALRAQVADLKKEIGRLRGGDYRLPPHAGEVLYLFGFPDGADASDDLRVFWRTDRHPMELFVNCSDLFYWATADLEIIKEEDMPLLRQTLKDLKGINAYSEIWAGDLFCCRKRKMRPQQPYLDRINDATICAMFEACGPVPVDVPEK